MSSPATHVWLLTMFQHKVKCNETIEDAPTTTSMRAQHTLPMGHTACTVALQAPMQRLLQAC